MTPHATRPARATARQLVLELRHGWARATECRGTNGNATCAGSASGELACDPFGGDAETAGAEIRLMLEQAGLRTGHAVVAVPMAWAMTHAFDAPDLPAEDFTDFLAIEAEKAFPFSPDDMVVSHTRCARADKAGTVILAAMPASRVDALEAVLRAARIAPTSIVLACAVAADAAAGIALIAEGRDLVLRVRSASGLLALRVLCHVAPGAGIEDDAVRLDILRELRGVLRMFSHDLQEADKSLSIHAPAELADQLADQLAGVAAKLGLAVEVVPGDSSATALALHRSAASGEAGAFEFLRPRITRWQRSFSSMRERGFLLRALVAACAVLVLCTGVFIFHAWRANHLEAKWNGMKDDVGHVKAYEDDIRAWRPWFDASLPSLDLVRSMTEAFPTSGEVTARTLQVKDRSAVTCSGTAQSAEAFVRFQTALGARPGISDLKVQQIRGDAPVQFSLTFSWNPRGKT